MQIFLTRLEIYEQRGGKSQRLLTGSANTKIYTTHQKKEKKRKKHGFLFFFPWRRAISACTSTDGGLLVVRGPSGRRSGPPLQSHASGSKALCGSPVEFKCQSPWPPSAISLLFPPPTLSFATSPSLSLSSLRSTPVFVRVGD